MLWRIFLYQLPFLKDFSNSNYISLKNLHGIILRLIFPEAFFKSEKFNLTADDYKYIYKYMSMFTRKSKNQKINSLESWDHYGKFFMFDDKKVSLGRDIRIFKKLEKYTIT